MVSLELNMEGTIKTLKRSKAGDMDCILFEVKNVAKKKKLEPSLHEEGQQEQVKSLHVLQARIEAKIIIKAKELSPILELQKPSSSLNTTLAETTKRLPLPEGLTEQNTMGKNKNKVLERAKTNKAKKQEELDKNDPELLSPLEVLKELDVMGKPKLVKKAETLEEHELIKREEAKKQEELKKHRQAKRRLQQHFHSIGEQIFDIKTKLVLKKTRTQEEQELAEEDKKQEELSKREL